MTALSAWENFYVIVGSSAGALIGLQFVVITLIASHAHRTRHGAGRRGVFYPERRPFWGRAAAGRNFECAMAGDLPAPLLGACWASAALCMRSSLARCDRQGATCIQARVRRLVVSCVAAAGGVRHAGRNGLRGWFSFTRGIVCIGSGGLAAVIWHSQSSIILRAHVFDSEPAGCVKIWRRSGRSGVLSRNTNSGS